MSYVTIYNCEYPHTTILQALMYTVFDCTALNITVHVYLLQYIVDVLPFCKDVLITA